MIGLLGGGEGRYDRLCKEVVFEVAEIIRIAEQKSAKGNPLKQGWLDAQKSNAPLATLVWA